MCAEALIWLVRMSCEHFRSALACLSFLFVLIDVRFRCEHKHLRFELASVPEIV